MNILPPSGDELARLLDDARDRYPAKATLGPLVGDGGVSVNLPVIFANPKPGSLAFSNAIAVALRLIPDDDPTGEQLVKACLVYPSLATWMEWRSRWAAIDATASKALAMFLGTRLGQLGYPAEDEQPPAGITLTTTGVWRKLLPVAAEPIHIVVDPPGDEQWRMFVSTSNKATSAHFDLALDMATACLKQSTMPIDQLFKRYPGFVVPVVAVIAQLAGNAATVTLGEW